MGRKQGKAVKCGEETAAGHGGRKRASDGGKGWSLRRHISPARPRRAVENTEVEKERRGSNF